MLSGSPCPSEPLLASTPGIRSRSGWVPRGESASVNVSSVPTGRKPLAREDREVGHRPVALGQDEPVAGGVVGSIRRDVEDPVVEHPQDVEGRVGAGLVLLVAAHEPDQGR